MTTATKSKRKCDSTKLEVRDKWSRISYGKVISVGYGNVEVQNEYGMIWTIGTDIFEKEFFTSDQFNETKEVNRTEMIATIVGNPRIIMSVHFKKKPDHKILVAAVTELLDDVHTGSELPTSRKLSTLLKTATAGDERTMIGRHYGVQDDFGRLQFTDMEATGSPLKQVDPRTVEWSIIGNVKYVLK